MTHPEKHSGMKWSDEVGEYVDKEPEEVEWPVYDEAKGG